MKNFYRELLSSYKIRRYEDGFLITTDIIYFGADERASFYVKPLGDFFVVSDLGQTLSYLSKNADIEHYRAKIGDLLRRFDAVLDQGEIRAVLPPFESKNTIRRLNNFIFTTGLIANIDLI